MNATTRVQLKYILEDYLEIGQWLQQIERSDRSDLGSVPLMEDEDLAKARALLNELTRHVFRG